MRLVRSTGAIPLVAGALFAANGILLAQAEDVRVPHRISCQTCRVEFTEIAQIGARSDPVRISPFSGLARDREGRFFAASDDFQLLVYDARGKFLKALGRRGDGPGEFSGNSARGGIASVAVGAGDSIFVFHPPKVSVFSPELAFVRTVVLPFTTMIGGAHPLKSGHWAIGSIILTAAREGRPIHVMDSDGRLIRSLGRAIPLEGRLGPIFAAPFRLTPDERSIWVANQYSLERWSLTDTSHSRLDVYNVPFLPTPGYVTVPRATGAGRDAGTIRRTVGGGSAALTGIDTVGRLWIFGRPPPTVRSASGVNRSGFLELLDPRSGEVLLSQQVAGLVGLLPDGDLAYRGSTTEDGHLNISIMTYRVIRP